MDRFAEGRTYFWPQTTEMVIDMAVLPVITAANSEPARPMEAGFPATELPWTDREVAQ
ncbi:hypothetical protein [Streptomyces tsukubensis]|uniref:hypothetical protein n=1 Tax=Streptomyces tsukubensis TaxID=83656 RepID=UPI001872DCD4|nr:hypothetical protein [Streptomyces tsukubensis]